VSLRKPLSRGYLIELGLLLVLWLEILGAAVLLFSLESYSFGSFLLGILAVIFLTYSFRKNKGFGIWT
jgi:hypothetical protein